MHSIRKPALRRGRGEGLQDTTRPAPTPYNTINSEVKVDPHQILRFFLYSPLPFL